MRPRPRSALFALAAGILGGCNHDVAITHQDKDNDGAHNGIDCNDARDDVYPGAPELCDEQDNDCDGEVDEGLTEVRYADADGDGFGDPRVAVEGCDLPSDYITDNTDCDDDDGAVNPAAAEVCDGIDNNCDGVQDEGLTTEWYVDADGDGYGDETNTAQLCEEPTSGYLQTGGDCDDTDSTVYPGAQEVCDDEIDQDCDNEDTLCRIRLDLALDTDANIALTGESGGSRAGSVLDLVEDIDGNGINEILVGAPGGCPGGGGGCAYLVELQSSAAGLLSLAPGAGLSHVSRAASHSTPSAAFADAVANLGDLNGDGRPEFGAVSEASDAVEINGGFVQLWASDLVSGTTLSSSHGPTLRPDKRYRRIGVNLAGGGDLSGDGYGDFILAARTSVTTNGGTYGELLVYHGCPEGLGRCYDTDLNGSVDVSIEWDGVMDYNSPDARLTGDAGARLGEGLATRFDYNADGFADIAGGAPGLDAGEVYLFTDYPFVTTAAANASTVTWFGEDTGDEAGVVVTAVGDLDQDGYDDLAIGAPAHDAGRGAVYLVFGRSDVDLTHYGDEVSLADAEVKLLGKAEGDAYGSSTSIAGDLNGDTFVDLLIGAPGADPDGLADAGEVEALLGPPVPGAAMDVQSTLYGIEAGGLVGSAVEGGLDVNGDGSDDILVGASGFGSGRVFVLFGGALL